MLRTVGLWSTLTVLFVSVWTQSSLGAADKDVIHIVTLGDSITKGVRSGVTVEETFSHRLERALMDRGLAVKISNLGVGGERTDQALKRLEAEVLAKQPQIVTIMYGTNDSYIDQGKSASRITAAEYRANLTNLVRRLREAGVRPVLMTEPRWGKSASLNGVGEHPNVRLEQYLAECRSVATELKVPLVDHYLHWLKAEQGGRDLGAWTTDQCHPNPAGHQVLLETMLLTILREVEQITKP